MRTRTHTTTRSPTESDDPLGPEERETGQAIALFVLAMFVALLCAIVLEA